ncbi:group 3 secretory phospholipase A2 [Oncorhynchus tshawytscha]|uniref:group 3 secretory phospholipase A2 n=1 Tax=Oncorhynchus tshawytscha TaxID=74940 RepID=UPI001C3CB221|nr:group 3 secretory phospholipase A2 [Oncorhynchus tshawytscha]
MHINSILFSAVIMAAVSLMLTTAAAADPRDFCFWTKVTSNGETHLSFLRHHSETHHASSSSLHLYHSVWSVGNRLVNCAVSDDTAVTDSYMSVCREKNTTGEFSDRPCERFDVNAQSELESHCAPVSSPTVTQREAVGDASEEHRETRRKRHARSVIDDIAFQNPLGDGGDSSRDETQTHRRVKRGLIVPGTLWCGSGNKAETYDDLGVFAETDSCCREHDQCQDTILSFETNYGVFNTNIFTLSHCHCDNRFHQCLLGAEDSISDTVGYVFFNLLKMHCFEFSHRLQCSQRNWFGMCQQYEMSLYAVVHPPTFYNSTQPDPDLEEDDMADNTTTTIFTPTSTSPSNSTTSSSTSSSTISTSISSSPSITSTSPTFPYIATSTSPSTSPSTSTLTSPSTPPSTSTPTTPSSAAPADLTPGGQSGTPASGSPVIHPYPGEDNVVANTSPTSTTGTATAIGTQSSTSGLETSASGPALALASPAEPTHHTGLTLPKSNQDAASTGKQHVYVCDVYRDLDDCRFKIPAHQKRYSLLNPEPRTLFHCNCTSRLSEVLVQQKEISGVQTILLKYISLSCFTLQPQVCTQGTSCSASLVKPSPAQLEQQKINGGGMEEWRHLQAVGHNGRRPKSRWAKRRLHKLCIRMTRKHSQCALVEDAVPM